MNAAAPIAEPQTHTPEAAEAPAPALRGAPDQPISIYEVHLPSWMRVPEERNRSLNAPEIAPKLADHVQALNFTHVQLLLVDREEAKYLVEYLHQRDLGVILEADPFANQPDFGSPAVGQCTNGETFLSERHYQWDNGWAEEAVAYFTMDPLYRKFRQARFTQRDLYAFDANYILPLSHRLVAKPRPSLFGIMPGDTWQKFANLRLLFAYQFLLPGKKLIFMGNEFGQQNPWQPESSLDWHLLNTPGGHSQLLKWVANLNRFYRGETALHQTDVNASGFQWIDTSDAASSVISFLRKSATGDELLLAVFNFTPVPRQNYRVGVPKGGYWTEILNSDAHEFGGSGQGNLGGTEAAPLGWNFQSHSLMLTLPPLAAIVLKAP